MTAAELDAEVAEFDKESLVDYGFKPLTPEQRKLWERAKRKGRPGRPRIGQGSKRVLVSIEGGLLKEADRFAKKHGLTRAALVSQALKQVLGKTG